MSGESDDLILVHVRRPDQKLDRVTDDVRGLKHSVTSLEGRMGGVRADMATMSLPIDRIERRLDPVAVPSA